MSCIASPLLYIIAFAMIIAPALVVAWMLKCRVRTKVLFVFVTVALEFVIIAGQPKLCGIVPLACSYFFSLIVIVVVPLVMFWISRKLVCIAR